MNTSRRSIFRRVFQCLTVALAARVIPKEHANISLLSDGGKVPTGKITPEVEARLKAYWKANFSDQHGRVAVVWNGSGEINPSDEEIVTCFHMPRTAE